MDIVNIMEGKLLVVPSLRGNWRAYQAVMRAYEEMKADKAANYLVIPGNIIHAEPGMDDASLRILDDLIERTDESVVSLLGARELAHIYHFEMPVVVPTTIEVNGQEKRALEAISVVQRLEDQIEQLGVSRDKYIEFMKSMPYGITTTSVMVNSAGGNRPMAGFAEPEYVGICVFTLRGQVIEAINHDILLDYFKGRAREEYAETGNLLAEDFFEGFTPLIGKTFRKSDLGQYLLAVFAPQAGQNIQMRELMQKSFLSTWSQRFLVNANPTDRLRMLKNSIMLQPFSTQEYEFAALIDAGRTYFSVDEIEKEMQLIKVE